MTMSCLMLHWLERLRHAGIIVPNASMMEFGPQDLDIPKNIVEASARRMMPAGRVAERMDAIFDGWGNPHRACQADFYSLFGVTRYVSSDPFDSRADYRYDLNYFFPHFRRYDLVTNFGTAEHVFNIPAVFRTAHRLLRTGGVLLNVLPSHGDIDHGFYNIHPILYRGLAAHSGFEICDFQYIDDIDLRTAAAIEADEKPYDFSALPIQLSDCGDERAFKRKVYEQYLLNDHRRQSSKFSERQRASMVFDYCYVALRKVRRGRFRIPYQHLRESSLAVHPPTPLRNMREFATGWFRRESRKAIKRGINLARRARPFIPDRVWSAASRLRRALGVEV